MFSSSRTIIGLIFFGISFLVIYKSKATRKVPLYGVFAGIAVVLVAILNFVPYENLFHTFDSPSAAYDYCKSHKTEIDLIVEGDACDFVIDREGTTFNSLMIPKTENGWKIGLDFDRKIVFHTFTAEIDIMVYQYKKTNDFFIEISGRSGETYVITDSYNTEFQTLRYESKNYEKPIYKYYAYIPGYNSQYSVTVNGIKYQLN